jgi:3',5'-cyclic AMP phosphodiesterase CpdA
MLLSACDGMFDYSPYAIDFSEENMNVNEKNISKLIPKEPDDTLTIAFTGDTHRFYDQTEAFVEKVNQNPAVDFVIHVGDMADFGLPKQYTWGNSFLLKLTVPYFVVVGNHDLVGNGLLAYTEMFGALNFSFIYDRLKFIFINTNGLEFKFNGEVPDVQWLDAQLSPNNDFSKAIVIFHIPPMNCDFDSSLEDAFRKTLALHNNVLFTVHGHLHGHEIYKPYEDSITYVNVYGVENMKFNLIKISNNQFDVETVAF